MKKGIAASKGYAIGKIFIKEDINIEVVEKSIDNIEEEKERFKSALSNTRDQLERIKDKAQKEVGAEKAAVFDSHIMLLDDPEFAGAVEMNIESNKVNSEKALQEVIDMYSSIFASMEDEYMRERGADIKDVGKRIMLNLMGKSVNSMDDLDKDTIIVAQDLTPSDTAQLDKEKVIAFLTNIGGRTSHSAIMARTLEIPAIVGMKDITESVKNGDVVIVDGIEGIVIINPDKETIEKYEESKRIFLKEKEEIKETYKC